MMRLWVATFGAAFVVGCSELPLCVPEATAGSQFELETVSLFPADSEGQQSALELVEGRGNTFRQERCNRPFISSPGVRVTVTVGNRNALGGDSRDTGACDVLRCARLEGLVEDASGEIQDFTPALPIASTAYEPNYCLGVTRDAADVQLISNDGETGVLYISFGGTVDCGEAWLVRFLGR